MPSRAVAPAAEETIRRAPRPATAVLFAPWIRTIERKKIAPLQGLVLADDPSLPARRFHESELP
jgi:hypothetical protein